MDMVILNNIMVVITEGVELIIPNFSDFDVTDIRETKNYPLMTTVKLFGTQDRG